MSEALPASLSQTGLLQADAAWRCIDLLSDVHLQAGMPLTFQAWRHHLETTPAQAVLMLGDLFEVWIGDDARALAFEAECLRVLQQAAKRLYLAFMPGNRDFLLGEAMLQASGMQFMTDPTLLAAFGQRWLLTHGDALCLSDTPYQAFRQMVRAPAWQQNFLAQPLAARQQQARRMREASTQHQAAQTPAQWSDVDDAAACQWLDAAGAPAMIHGHTHRPATHELPGGKHRHVLGDWDLDTQPARAQAFRLTPQGLSTLHIGLG